MTRKDTLFMLGILSKYDIEDHPYGYIVIVNKIKMKAIKDKKKYSR